MQAPNLEAESALPAAPAASPGAAPIPQGPRPSLATCRSIVRMWEELDLEEQVERNRRRLEKLVIPYAHLLASPPPLGTRGKRPLIFMHIPKCGGTTLEYLISKNYQINGVLHINAPAAQRNPRALFKKGRFPHVVMGHHKLNQPLYQLASRHFVHMTVLREPVSRTLSYYNYLRTSEGHGKHELVRNLTLDQFVSSDELVELDNAQTLRLAGVLRRREIRSGRLGPQTLDAARETLTKRISLFGLTERFDEFLLMLRRLLGWADIFYQRRNVSKARLDRAAVDPAIVERIRERNALDVELYRFAEELFDERCREVGVTADAVTRLAEANRRYTAIVEDPILGDESA